MQKCLFQIILITLITSTPLFAELNGYAIPKNDRIYLGQTSDFFCPIPADSSFKIILGIRGGLNGFYHNGLLGNIPVAAESNLFITFQLIGRSQIQIDGGYYGFDDWQNKANIGINYIYDFSIPLAGITYIAISPGFHFLGINKTEPIILEDGHVKSIYEPDLHTTVSYRTNLNSTLSYQLKIRISKLFGIIKPYFSLSIYYHLDHFSQNGSYYNQNEWNYTGIQNINYKDTDLVIHTGFSLIGRKNPFFTNFSIGINPGYTKPFNNIPAPISLSVGYRFKTQ